MAADSTDANPKPSPLAGLVIPLLLIAAAGVVFGVFYALNQRLPPPTTDAPPTTATAE